MPYFDNLWHIDSHDNKAAFTHRTATLEALTLGTGQASMQYHLVGAGTVRCRAVCSFRAVQVCCHAGAARCHAASCGKLPQCHCSSIPHHVELNSAVKSMCSITAALDGTGRLCEIINSELAYQICYCLLSSRQQRKS